jgi:hypothetical protein
MIDPVHAETSGIATLFERWSQAEKRAYDELLTHLYGDIHAIAVRHLRRERCVTIQATALVNEFTYVWMNCVTCAGRTARSGISTIR